MQPRERADDETSTACWNNALRAFSCIVGPFHLVWIALFWPLLSILFGILSGTVVGAGATVIVFLVTLVRTPLHIGKMLWVAATTQDVFQGQCYNRFILRFVVLLCVPVMHVVFLVGITATCATIGTLHLIGLATKLIYQGDRLSDVANNMVSNICFRQGSRFGQYLQGCQEYMQYDEESYPTLCFLKGTLAVLPGIVVAILVFIPYSVAVMAITLYRLPVNVYATVRITTRTVLLKWDLRLVVLILLPLIHLLFPLLGFIGSLLGSFTWTWCVVGANVYKGKSIFHNLFRLRESLKEYYEAHVRFVTVECHPYDHPTGIPDGWDGTRYGLEVERLLRWQRDLLLACLLILLELPTCIVMTTAIGVIMYIPSVLFTWKKYVTEHCCCCRSGTHRDDEDLITALRFWPFHVIAILCVPVFILVCFVVFSIVNVLDVVCEVASILLSYGDGFNLRYDGSHGRWRTAWMVQFEFIGRHDEWIGDAFCGEHRLLAKWTIFTRSRLIRPNAPDHDARRLAVSNGAPISSEVSYWDRFVSQCIHTTSDLLKRQIIDGTDVQGMAPAAILSIPAVAILTVLVDSVQDPELGRDDIKWNIDGSICKGREHPANDGIEELMWPMVVDIMRDLKRYESNILTASNVEVIQAMLCDNTERRNESILRVLDEADPKNHAMNNRIRTKINSLALSMLRVRPYQSKMMSIFSYTYDDELDGLEQAEQNEGRLSLSKSVPVEAVGNTDHSSVSETTVLHDATSTVQSNSSFIDAVNANSDSMMVSSET